uniref:Serine/threonine-protein phosphatase 6 regulatory ankyrin repeat subunit C-like n=1 Tax=Crassostrea virginica TaxID=6565 RepID=A0A8B8APD3_CRAVI|nr:serine/threonine-protein phosphatase 6 regulatory ankyrin repeat subunit C-like [Crassostrea virginica]
MMDGYKFPVYSTDFCPRNETEWNKRASVFNCTGEDSTYACFPNDDITQLIEFCYPLQIIAIPAGLCLYLSKESLKMEAHDCKVFKSGCPEIPYMGSTIYKYPSCVSIGNGCFLAEPLCEKAPKNPTPETTVMIPRPRVWIAILPGLFIPPCTVACLVMVFLLKRKISEKHKARKWDEEDPTCQESTPLLRNHEKENPYEMDVFENWRRNDKMFLATMASKKVENLIRDKNLVIVTGDSGCGKKTIVQHIALKYMANKWVVKPVDVVEEIKTAYTSGNYIKNKTIFVLNDPIGKESLDDILYSTWKKYEKTLSIFLQSVKLVLTCRKKIVFDDRVKGLFEERSNIVVVDDNHNKLSIDEKRKFLTKYTKIEGIFDDKFVKVLENETYFPLLCKLFSSDLHRCTDYLQFFSEPIDVFRKEIEICKVSNKEIYCGLVCLILFNNNMSQNKLMENEDIFRKCLHLSSIKEYLPPAEILRHLERLEGFLIKKICGHYSFYHDFIMEVTNVVFGTDHPEEILRYADIGFLQRRVRIENCSELNDPFIITLSDPHINDLVNRLSEDIFTDRFLEVALNPCLRDEKVSNLMIEKLQNDPKALKMILKEKTLEKVERDEDSMWKDNWFSRLDFVNMFREISPLSALIIFRHDKLARFFLESLKREIEKISQYSLFSAICCNGSNEFFDFIPKRKVMKCLKQTESVLHPIHIVSIFNNYKLLSEIVTRDTGIDVNMITKGKNGWTPLTLAVANKLEESFQQFLLSSKNKTVEDLLSMGAEINKCTKDKISPLYIACQNGHETTVELLLRKEADVNLCTENGTSPLFISCQKGHDKMVKQLLAKGADKNLCDESGNCPLFISCKNGHNETAKLLLDDGADVNVCNKSGKSPLFIASENGNENAVKFLLENGADVNLCDTKGKSPLYIACKNGHEIIAQILLNRGAEQNSCTEKFNSPLYIASQYGHNRTVNVLLQKNAEVNLCNKSGASPLYTACENGHELTAQILLDNGAEQNLCTENGNSPLYIASQNGHNRTVDLLLKKNADVNLCNETGANPLYTACENGHEITTQILLDNGAEQKLCTENGNSPLHVASQNGYNKIVDLLLENNTEVNARNKAGASPLYTACEKGHDSIVHILIDKGAEVNLCAENGNSPLYIASQNGHQKTVERLLNTNAEVNACNTSGATPLFIAYENRHDSIIQLLLSHGADLYTACQNGHDSIVRILLQNGVDVNACAENGNSPLYIACQKGYDSIVEILLENDAEVNLCAENGNSPLHIACHNNNDRIMQLLLKNGADVNLCNKTCVSPLYVACENRNKTIVQLLLNYDADVNISAETGTSPFFQACQNGDLGIVQLLLKKDANVNLCKNTGASPLYLACQNGHYETVKFLIDNKAGVNLCKKTGASPLLEACRFGHYDTIHLLINNGADVNLCKDTGESSLYIASKNGVDRTVQLLLKNGADVNLCNKCGESPLFIASKNGHYDTVKLLLKNGAYVNLRNEIGESPLCISSENGQDSTVKILLGWGADVNLCDNMGNSPFFKACENGHNSIVQVLQENGADVNL